MCQARNKDGLTSFIGRKDVELDMREKKTNTVKQHDIASFGWEGGFTW